MALPDQDTGMVNGFRQAALENLSLQTTLQEVFNLQRQHVIQTHTRLVKHTNSNETTNKGVSLEKAFRIFHIELQELTSSTTNF